jgi:fused signal recognition particle receptor
MLRGLFKKIGQLIARRARIDEELFDELEEALIEADVGVHTATRLVQELRADTRRGELANPDEVRSRLRDVLVAILDLPELGLRWSPIPPTLCTIVGVNGTGKTTSIAKLAYFARRQQKKVVVAAADTFRAAAIDQLEVWSQRVGAELIKHREGADPAAVVFDAVQAARARSADLVIADTAGRLHTRANLMEELKKVHRVAERALYRAPDEVLLVLDATLGQNAVSQARSFAEALPVSGIILTKMDGTARGGVIVTVADEFKIPIKFAGTGEKPEDFSPFNPRGFVAALFDEEAPDGAC